MIRLLTLLLLLLLNHYFPLSESDADAANPALPLLLLLLWLQKLLLHLLFTDTSVKKRLLLMQMGNGIF